MLTSPRQNKHDRFYLLWVARFCFCCLMHVPAFQTFCCRAHCPVYFSILSWCCFVVLLHSMLFVVSEHISILSCFISSGVYALKRSTDFFFSPEPILKLQWKCAIVSTINRTLGESENCDMVHTCTTWSMCNKHCISVRFHTCQSPSGSVHL